MSERIFAVIGHPIGHTMSPFIHERLFALAHTEGTYTVLDVAPEELPVRIKELDRLAGYNITIPNKQHIIPFLDRLDKKAALYGSVNTVRNGLTREGFTTDPDGFLKALQDNHIPFTGKVVILGCGGVARTFAYEAVLAGCDVTLAVRPEDTAAQRVLVQEIADKLNGAAVQTALLQDLSGDIDLLVNATPVGMYPRIGTMPVSDKVLSRCANVFDAVYNPLETALVQCARANGTNAVGGMAMLVWQAAVSHEIWDGSYYSSEDIRQLVEDSANEQRKRFS